MIAGSPQTRRAAHYAGRLEAETAGFSGGYTLVFEIKEGLGHTRARLIGFVTQTLIPRELSELVGVTQWRFEEKRPGFLTAVLRLHGKTQTWMETGMEAALCVSRHIEVALDEVGFSYASSIHLVRCIRSVQR